MAAACAHASLAAMCDDSGIAASGVLQREGLSHDHRWCHFYLFFIIIILGPLLFPPLMDVTSFGIGVNILDIEAMFV